MADEKREERKLPQRVVNTKEKEASTMHKIATDFDLEPSRMVMSYLYEDKIKPWIKNGIYDMALGFLDRWLFHRSNPSSNYSYRGRGGDSFVSYNRQYNRYDDRDIERVNTRRDRFDFSRLRNDDGSPFTTAQVERIKIELTDIMNEYPASGVRVSDFNQIVGRSGDWTDNDWVWLDCRAFHFRQLPGGGWCIDFDPPVPARK